MDFNTSIHLLLPLNTGFVCYPNPQIMLSSKTPSMVGAPTFPEMLHHQQSSGQEHNMQSAMDLLYSYPRQQMHQYSEPTYDQGPTTPLCNTKCLQ